MNPGIPLPTKVNMTGLEYEPVMTRVRLRGVAAIVNVKPRDVARGEAVIPPTGPL